MKAFSVYISLLESISVQRAEKEIYVFIADLRCPSLIAQLISSLTRLYEMLHNEAGGEQTIRYWCANSSYAYARDVRVTLYDESFEGVTRGMEPDVAVRVETPRPAT